jgi:hypothetical protein
MWIPVCDNCKSTDVSFALKEISGEQCWTLGRFQVQDSAVHVCLIGCARTIEEKLASGNK